MVRATSTKSMGINAMDIHMHMKKKHMDVTGMPTATKKASSMSMATHMSINMSTASPPRRSNDRFQKAGKVSSALGARNFYR